MGLGARRDRAAQLRRSVTESQITLWRAQQNHGPRQQELLGCRLHDALKRDRIEWLEICCCLRTPADGASYSNQNTQYSRCHESVRFQSDKLRAPQSVALLCEQDFLGDLFRRRKIGLDKSGR